MDITSNKIQFSDEMIQEVNRLISHYPEGKQKAALIPLLHIAQEKLGDGWLPVPVMDYVAELLDIQPIEVYEVASFYTMFHLKPVGKYVLEVCKTSPCCHLGALEMVDRLCKKLNIEIGGTSEDGIFTVKTVECLASCGSAPMMQVGDFYYENLNEEKVDALLEKFLQGADPHVKQQV